MSWEIKPLLRTRLLYSSISALQQDLLTAVLVDLSSCCCCTGANEGYRRVTSKINEPWLHMKLLQQSAQQYVLTQINTLPLGRFSELILSTTGRVQTPSYVGAYGKVVPGTRRTDQIDQIHLSLIHI